MKITLSKDELKNVYDEIDIEKKNDLLEKTGILFTSKKIGSVGNF